MNKFELDTPCLVLDLDILEENLGKMQAASTAAGKKLRPHAKSHKCSALAGKQLEHGAVGICAAKVSEAEVLVNNGIHGVLVTGPVASEKKAARLVTLLKQSPSLMTVVDHAESIELIDRLLTIADLHMDVLVDIDVGLQRTGVPPFRALELVDRVRASKNLRLKGIQAYAGQVQHIHRYDERKKVSIECMSQAAEIFRQLQTREASCMIFSGAGTGTCEIDLGIAELTELQVGSYALMDAEYLAIETARYTELVDFFPAALTMLTTVISASHDTHVTVDAGLKALYRDGGQPQVVTAKWRSLRYDWFGDEYGMLRAENKTTTLPRLGKVIELVVSHCDPTVNQFDGYFLTRNNKVVDQWPIDLRGRSQ
ncbi:MAG: DSD1 family PLP-dependent enzyme [bacterium]|nr:DSD1 family PLP-dependent enzyme [bacterium]